MNPDSPRDDRAGTYLAFPLGDEYYGLPILAVQEIIGLMAITAVPWTPPFVRGVVNLRGKVLPIVDLRRRFGLPADEERERCIMVLQVSAKAGGHIVMGLIIDHVPDVHAIAGADIEDPPSFCGGSDAAFVLGVAKVGERVVMLLDSDLLLGQGKLEHLQQEAEYHE